MDEVDVVIGEEFKDVQAQEPEGVEVSGEREVYGGAAGAAGMGGDGIVQGDEDGVAQPGAAGVLQPVVEQIEGGGGGEDERYGAVLAGGAGGGE